ncbi:MAG: CRISPR-associated protein Csm6, partial [Clostridiales bacterium]|nr:CRISPR-associated protein Csm6 [Clostridiales bacterium]
MEDYVLFSSIGGHDPIANYHDGAMLHICRTYKPKKIYLYLTKEMLERSSKDNRYCESLKKLQRHLNYTIEEIQTIERPNLTEVHIFDTFFNDFESIINEIHEKNPNETILLNLSSGTPAMKSALNIIATMARYKKMVAVQVPTPTGKENAKDEDHDKFDLDVYWELDEDNRPDWKSRCKEIVSINLMAKINKEIIIRFIKAYDYSAALSVSKDIADFLPENSLNFLTAAYCRLQLDQSGYDKALNG